MTEQQTQQHPNYKDVLPPSERDWLDITNPTDRMMGMKVFLNTHTQQVVSYPFHVDGRSVDG